MRYFFLFIFLFLSANGFAEEEQVSYEECSFDKSYTEKGITLGTQTSGFDQEPDHDSKAYIPYAVLQQRLLPHNWVAVYQNDQALIPDCLRKFTHFRRVPFDDSTRTA